MGTNHNLKNIISCFNEWSIVDHSLDVSDSTHVKIQFSNGL